jgi:hypothetical protein
MGLFDGTKKMSHDELWDIIDEVSGLTPQEKEYAKAVLDKYTIKKMGESKGGMTKDEAHQAFRELLSNHKDFLSPDDIRHVETKIFDYFHG